MPAEYNLYSCIYTCMKTWPCFEKTNVFKAGWDSATDISVTLTCRAFCSHSKLLIAFCHVLEIIIVRQDRASNQFKNCSTAPWKFSEWNYRRLRITSRTRSSATQELSEKIHRSCFHFLNMQFWNIRKIPTPLWFSRNPLRERLKHLHLNNIQPSEN